MSVTNSFIQHATCFDILCPVVVNLFIPAPIQKPFVLHLIATQNLCCTSLCNAPKGEILCCMRCNTKFRLSEPPGRGGKVLHPKEAKVYSKHGYAVLGLNAGCNKYGFSVRASSTRCFKHGCAILGVKTKWSNLEMYAT